MIGWLQDEVCMCMCVFVCVQVCELRNYVYKCVLMQKGKYLIIYHKHFTLISDEHIDMF